LEDLKWGSSINPSNHLISYTAFLPKDLQIVGGIFYEEVNYWTIQIIPFLNLAFERTSIVLKYSSQVLVWPHRRGDKNFITLLHYRLKIQRQRSQPP
jgi:hypothetical protein